MSPLTGMRVVGGGSLGNQFIHRRGEPFISNGSETALLKDYIMVPHPPDAYINDMVNNPPLDFGGGSNLPPIQSVGVSPGTRSSSLPRLLVLWAPDLLHRLLVVWAPDLLHRLLVLWAPDLLHRRRMLRHHLEPGASCRRQLRLQPGELPEPL